MNAICRIKFKDGTEKVLDLGKSCIEIDVSTERKQSINIEQSKDKFRLAYTKPLMDNKTWDRIIIEKISS